MQNTTVGMILAAGFGTRLKELTSIRPKPLMEIGNKTIIAHQIAMLENAGTEDIYINLHHHPEQIIDAINELSPKARIHFSIEETILGTAGGVRRVIDKFNIANKNMILLHGDMICDYDLTHILPSFITLVIAKNRMLDGYKGSVSIDDKDAIIELGAHFRSTAKKIASGFFTGIHFLSAEALHLLQKSKSSCLISELYPEWLKEGRILRGEIKELSYEDLGTPERLLKSNIEWCQDENFAYLGRTEQAREDKKRIYFGKGIKIHKSAHFIAPLVIGDGAIIEANARLGPNAIIGPHSHVGEGAALSNCLLMSKTRIEKDERLDCVIALSKARVLVKN